MAGQGSDACILREAKMNSGVEEEAETEFSHSTSDPIEGQGQRVIIPPINFTVFFSEEVGDGVRLRPSSIEYCTVPARKGDLKFLHVFCRYDFVHVQHMPFQAGKVQEE